MPSMEQTRPSPDAARTVQSEVRVLVAGDDAVSRHSLAANLAEFGFWTLTARNREEVRSEIERGGADVLILDGSIEELPSSEACANIRSHSDIGIVALLPPGSHGEALRCFDAGADDCLVRPLEVAELGRRVEALVRRSRRSSSAKLLRGPSGLEVYPSAHEVTVSGKPVDLTPKEFAVLEVLLQNRGNVMTADSIAERIWGYQTLGSRNFVEAHVSRLRSKLRTAGCEDAITTVRGVGYKIR